MRLRELLTGHAADVAPLLLNATVESFVDGELVRLRITEVEAYGGVGEDPGSHAFRRKTPRNATMFGAPGGLYCYFTYGMHWCANIVTGPVGVAGAVLLRAGEVTTGIDVARARRPRSSDRDLARGPARLATALGLTGEVDGISLLARSSPVRIKAAAGAAEYETSPRTGVAGDGAPTPWRFYLPGEPTVSPFRPAQSRTK